MKFYPCRIYFPIMCITNRELCSFRLTENGQPYFTTPLGRSTSINRLVDHIEWEIFLFFFEFSSLSSHRRAFLSSSYSNLVSPFHLPLKRIKPEPWQRLFEVCHWWMEREIISFIFLRVKNNKNYQWKKLNQMLIIWSMKKPSIS